MNKSILKNNNNNNHKHKKHIKFNDNINIKIIPNRFDLDNYLLENSLFYCYNFNYLYIILFIIFLLIMIYKNYKKNNIIIINND